MSLAQPVLFLGKCSQLWSLVQRVSFEASSYVSAVHVEEQGLWLALAFADGRVEMRDRCAPAAEMAQTTRLSHILPSAFHSVAHNSLTLELLATVAAPAARDDNDGGSGDTKDAGRPWLPALRADWSSVDMPVVAMVASPNQVAVCAVTRNGELAVVPLPRALMLRPTRAALLPVLAAQAMVLALERRRNTWDIVRVLRDLQEELAMPTLVDETLACLFTYYGSRPAMLLVNGSAMDAATPAATPNAGATDDPQQAAVAERSGAPIVRYAGRQGPPMSEERVGTLWAFQLEMLRFVGCGGIGMARTRFDGGPGSDA